MGLDRSRVSGPSCFERLRVAGHQSHLSEDLRGAQPRGGLGILLREFVGTFGVGKGIPIAAGGELQARRAQFVRQRALRHARQLAFTRRTTSQLLERSIELSEIDRFDVATDPGPAEFLEFACPIDLSSTSLYARKREPHSLGQGVVVTKIGGELFEQDAEFGGRQLELLSATRSCRSMRPGHQTLEIDRLGGRGVGCGLREYRLGNWEQQASCRSGKPAQAESRRSSGSFARPASRIRPG